MKAAWQQVEAANTPEVRSKKYEEVMEWTMLDKEYDGHTCEVFTNGPVILPHWWRYSPGTPAPSTQQYHHRRGNHLQQPGGSGAPSLPHLPGSDFVALVVGGVQTFAAGVIGDLNTFTSGVTTGPIPSRSPPHLHAAAVRRSPVWRKQRWRTFPGLRLRLRWLCLCLCRWRAVGTNAIHQELVDPAILPGFETTQSRLVSL